MVWVAVVFSYTDLEKLHEFHCGQTHGNQTDFFRKLKQGDSSNSEEYDDEQTNIRTTVVHEQLASSQTANGYSPICPKTVQPLAGISVHKYPNAKK
ncbi:hypothetical protein OUZ56_010546 [Daphnia magna]|uniref:Uncharacterized protein n=1 Tax=Daphnia magna TaxID=35525 RepID=A0ABR0AIV3_9CRUS|nr:hypothetical protein OUZ56_010546 [Daphnia magna]